MLYHIIIMLYHSLSRQEPGQGKLFKAVAKVPMNTEDVFEEILLKDQSTWNSKLCSVKKLERVS
jgi:hypothetical protein